MSKLIIGCVADDFTGASDIASFFTKGGLHTILAAGIPSHTQSLSDAEAIVIALKCRTQETQSAVSDCITAFDLLTGLGARILYYKYCSTFDSTPKGNIGPVIDAVLERYHIPYTVLCPAIPINGRTVRNGILYVNGIPLAESHMRNHPLTPMWDSDVTELMRRQSKYPCYKIDLSLCESKAELSAKLSSLEKNNPHMTLVPDYYEDSHAASIIHSFGDLAFFTGGSGIATELASGYANEKSYTLPVISDASGRKMFAGSCSVATCAQVKHYLENGGVGYMINPESLLNQTRIVDDAWNFIRKHWDRDVLIYSSGSVGAPLCTLPEAANTLEQALAELVKRSVAHGCTRVISAGGETSGAIVLALNYRCFHIGESVAPGVPIMMPVEQPNLRIVLKSGNFGFTDFFSTALQ